MAKEAEGLVSFPKSSKGPIIMTEMLSSFNKMEKVSPMDGNIKWEICLKKQQNSSELRGMFSEANRRLTDGF